MLNYYFGKNAWNTIKPEVLKIAIERENIVILTQALLAKDIQFSDLSPELVEKIKENVFKAYENTEK